MKKIFLLSIVTFGLVFSQNENLNESFKYFPLHIGNYWEYKVERFLSLPNTEVDSTWYASSEITKDTLIENKLYYVFNDLNMKDIPSYRFIRLDSISGLLFQRFQGEEFIIDNLLSKVGDTLGCYFVKDIYSKNVFGLEKETKVYEQYCITTTGSSSWELSKDIGITSKNIADFTVFIILDKYELTYANINEVEYGIKTEVSDNYFIKDKYNLEQNFPNPFNPTTNINYYLPRNGFINISIYNLLGEKVTTLFYGIQKKGENKIQFNGSNLTSGVYYYVLDYGESRITRKMLLLK